MAQTLSRGERIVLGTLFLGMFLVGVFFIVKGAVATPFGRMRPDPALARPILIGALLTVAASLVLAWRYFKASGVRLVAKEAWPAFLFGGIVGVLGGLILRGIIPRGGFLVVLGLLYVGSISAIRWWAQKSPA